MMSSNQQRLSGNDGIKWFISQKLVQYNRLSGGFMVMLWFSILGSAQLSFWIGNTMSVCGCDSV